MLQASCYTTEELIHYAGIDDRFKPMLAERIAQEGGVHLREQAERIQEMDFRIDSLEDCKLRADEQTDWLTDLGFASRQLEFALETGATSAMRIALANISHVRKQISTHHSD